MRQVRTPRVQTPQAGTPRVQMPESKFFLRSWTIWGAIVAVLPNLLAAFGVTLPDGLLGEADSAVRDVILAADTLNEALGALLIVVGRQRASTRLTVLPQLGAAGLPFALLPFTLPLVVAGCGGKLPLSTGDDVEGYQALVASFAADPEKSARFDVVEAQADGIQALQLIERAITHPGFPPAGKPYLKRLAGQLTLALEDYTKLVTDCPGKAPATGACPGFDYRSAKVLAFRSILAQANREITRLAAQGLLGASWRPPAPKAPPPRRLLPVMRAAA